MSAITKRRSRGFGLIVMSTVITLLMPVIPSTALDAPNASILKVQPEIWRLNSDSLEITGNLDNAGKWKLELINLCTGETALTQTGEKNSSGNFDVVISSALTQDIEAGPFQISLTPSVGNKIGITKRKYLKIVNGTTTQTRNESFCQNATRVLSQNTVTSQISAINKLTRLNPVETDSAVLFGYGPTASSISAIATNFAEASGQIALATNPNSLSTSTLNEINRRAITSVSLVGSRNLISTEVTKALKESGVKVKRYSAETAIEISSLMWGAWSGEQFAKAILANFTSDSATLLQALSFANSQRLPLIPISNTSQKSTKQILQLLNINSGTAVASQTNFSDLNLAKHPGFVRLYNSDIKELTILLADNLFSKPNSLFLRDEKSAISILDITATALGGSVWPVAKSVSDFDVAYIATRPYIQKIVTTDFVTTLSDPRVAAYAREIYKRDAPKPVAELELPEIADLVAPANFAFSGSGWGHGIGMSQWGAYAMANSGKTAAEILTYYFSGTEIGPAVDNADVWVSLQNRIRSLTLRLREVNGDIGTWRLTADDGTEINLTANETASFSFDTQAIKVSVTTSKNQILGPTDKVIATWSGTRFDQDLGETPSAIQVIGPNETTSNGRLYRFGNLRIKAASATDTYVSGMQVTNRVSLHDEYIYGIGEVSNSWPTESLIAQAIAARSFAYNRAYNADGSLNNRMGACDCMVYDDIRDQNYVGWSKINSVGGDRWKSAVDATNVDATTSNFVLYNGKVVQTFYAAATGGFTQNNEDVWGGTPRPYYRAVEDPWSLLPTAAISVSVWSPRIRSQETLAAAFGLSDVAYLDLSDRYVSGGIRNAVAFSTTGASATISGERFRSRVQSVDGDTLQSTWVWKAGVKFGETAAPSFSRAILAERSLGFAKIPGATATDLVLVQNNSAAPANLAIASSLAGITKSALLVTKISDDANRVMELVSTNNVQNIRVVGQIDSNIVSALQNAGKTVTTYSGDDVFETANLVADSLTETNGQNYVLANLNNIEQLTVATSLSVRTKRTLLFTGDGLLNLNTAQYLLQKSEPNVIAVGSVSDISNAALAVVENVKRLSTEDLAEASLNVLYQNQLTTRGLVITNIETPIWKNLLLAGTGLPLIYDADSIRARAIKWLRRQPLSTVVVDLDANETFVTKVRRS